MSLDSAGIVTRLIHALRRQIFAPELLKEVVNAISIFLKAAAQAREIAHVIDFVVSILPGSGAVPTDLESLARAEPRQFAAATAAMARPSVGRLGRRGSVSGSDGGSSSTTSTSASTATTVPSAERGGSDGSGSSPRAPLRMVVADPRRAGRDSGAADTHAIMRNSLLTMLLDCVQDEDEDANSTFIDALLEAKVDASDKPSAQWLLLCLVPSVGALTAHLALRLWARLMKARPAVLSRVRTAGGLSVVRQLLQAHWHVATLYPTVVGLLLTTGGPAGVRLADDLGVDVPALLALFLRDPKDCGIYCKEAWSILLGMVRAAADAMADAYLPRRGGSVAATTTTPTADSDTAAAASLRASQALLTSTFEFFRELYLKVADFRELLGTSDAMDELVQAASILLVAHTRPLMEAHGGPPAVFSSFLVGVDTAAAAAALFGLTVTSTGTLVPTPDAPGAPGAPAAAAAAAAAAAGASLTRRPTRTLRSLKHQVQHSEVALPTGVEAGTAPAPGTPAPAQPASASASVLNLLMRRTTGSTSSIVATPSRLNAGQTIVDDHDPEGDDDAESLFSEAGDYARSSVAASAVSLTLDSPRAASAAAAAAAAAAGGSAENAATVSTRGAAAVAAGGMDYRSWQAWLAPTGAGPASSAVSGGVAVEALPWLAASPAGSTSSSVLTAVAAASAAPSGSTASATGAEVASPTAAQSVAAAPVPPLRPFLHATEPIFVALQQFLSVLINDAATGAPGLIAAAAAASSSTTASAGPTGSAQPTASTVPSASAMQAVGTAGRATLATLDTLLEAVILEDRWDALAVQSYIVERIVLAVRRFMSLAEDTIRSALATLAKAAVYASERTLQGQCVGGGGMCVGLVSDLLNRRLDLEPAKSTGFSLKLAFLGGGGDSQIASSLQRTLARLMLHQFLRIASASALTSSTTGGGDGFAASGNDAEGGAAWAAGSDRASFVLSRASSGMSMRSTATAGGGDAAGDWPAATGGTSARSPASLSGLIVACLQRLLSTQLWLFGPSAPLETDWLRACVYQLLEASRRPEAAVQEAVAKVWRCSASRRARRWWMPSACSSRRRTRARPRRPARCRRRAAVPLPQRPWRRRQGHRRPRQRL